MMGKFLAITTALCSSLLIFGCSSGGGGNGGGQTTEVWIGNYSGSAPTSGDAPTGKICLKLTQNGAQVTGSAWVAGWLWKADFSGTLTNNTQLSGSASGQDLEGNNITVDYNLTISGNTITGSITVNGATTYNFSVNLQKDPNKTDCGWASRELANAFAQALGGAISGNPSSPNPLGNELAAFITEVPKVNVKIDGNTYPDWWACIWEVRDRTTTPATEYTVAGIIDTSNVQRMAGWYVQNSTPNIGVDSSLGQQIVNASLDNSNNPAVYTDGTLIFAADGSGDTYFNNGTRVSGDPFFVSPCVSGTQYKVWMSEITSFYIKFDGPSFSLTPTNHSFESPPNASSSNQNTNIPALYIEKVTCTP